MTRLSQLTHRTPVRKQYHGGTHRIMEPEETWKRVQPILSRTGITRVANVTGLDHIGIPVFMVCRPNARSVSVSQGKGLSVSCARVSGVMEALELFHAENIHRPLHYSSYNEMSRRKRTTNVERICKTRHSPFNKDTPILWIEGVDLLSNEPTWVPYECVSMNTSLPHPPGSGCFLATSNGLASGNDIVEAVNHGLYEVIERDATTLWHFSDDANLSNRLLDLDTVDDVACKEGLERCRQAGVFVLAWDLTSDVGIPTFACLIGEDEYGLAYQRSAASGYGCHLDRGIALLRAITEAVQSRLTYIAGSRDDLFRDEYKDNVQTRIHLRQCEVLRGIKGSRKFHEIAVAATETVDSDLQLLIRRLQDVGVDEIVAVDLSDPELEVPVARVVVPGLEGPHSDPDYVPGPRGRAAQEVSV
ncbi:hypothetical protein NIES30_17425 [Phormidium tenue NIES-30]|uniref:YcaO domain-containing protein n=1 Tax=Phormidium tenue NIES-30 TaxID=549789 RepID=A0A1U7J2C6_9CYAN|nr:hypothetical protein NIES30_17425 [Phormidium tenue NIES-30]